MFAQILSTDGLIWMICAALVAGIVRGFAGFGTAMIFLPVAGQFLSPFWAITVLTVMDIFGPLPLVRRAWRDAHRPDLRRLTIAMVITLPLALMVLSHIDPQVFRYFGVGAVLGDACDPWARASISWGTAASVRLWRRWIGRDHGGLGRNSRAACYLVLYGKPPSPVGYSRK